MHEPERFPDGKDATTLEEARALLVAARQTIHEVHKRLFGNSDNSAFRSPRGNVWASATSHITAKSRQRGEGKADASMSKDRIKTSVSLPALGTKSRDFGDKSHDSVTARLKKETMRDRSKKKVP